MHRVLALTIWLACLLGAAPVFAQVVIVVDGKTVITGGEMCSTGEVLVGFNTDGTSVCECQQGREVCGLDCVDLQTDNQHCGACDTACVDDAPCVNGRCRECDVLAQDCTVGGEACYYSLLGDQSSCAAPFPTNPPGEQGDECSFINGCAEGYGCVLLQEDQDGEDCAFFCDPDFKGLLSADEICETVAGPGARCLRSNDFYADAGADDVSFCVPSTYFP